MINEALDILFNQAGQSIFFDVPQGRPSSVSGVQVFRDTSGDDSTAESATTGAAAIDAVNTTFDQASGPSSAVTTDRRRCYLASTANIVAGRHYLATNQLGVKTWVDVVGISSGDYVQARSSLQDDFPATTSTFVGTRISIGLDATWLADRAHLSDPYWCFPVWRAVWTYVVASVTYRAATYFDVVRYPTTFGVTAADVELYAPGWTTMLPVDDLVGTGERMIRAAVRQVKRDLARAGRQDWAQRNSEAFNDLIAMRAATLVYKHAVMYGGASREQLAIATDEYWTHFNEWVGQAKAAEALASDGAGGRREYSSILRR